MTNAHWATRSLDLDEIPARKPPPPTPKPDRDSQIMEGGKDARYYRRYYKAPKKASPGITVRFCWTTARNVAGCYLTYTEVLNGSVVSRSNWHGWKTKKAAMEYCRDRYFDASKPKAQRRYLIPRPN